MIPVVGSLEPADMAGAHFLLAKLLHQSKDPAAKRHALLALEVVNRVAVDDRHAVERRRDRADNSQRVGLPGAEDVVG